MKGRVRVAWGLLVAVIVAGMPAVAMAENLSVDRTAIDFGCVAVGDTAVESLTVTSEGPTPLAIETVEIRNDAAGVFEFIDPPEIPPFLDPGESLVFDIGFSPLAEADYDGTVVIISDNVGGEVRVSLSGHGAEGGCEADPSALAEELQEFVETSARDGDLRGTGRRRRARIVRLHIFMLKIALVRWFIDNDMPEAACPILHWLERRSDGARHPRDFVTGPATPEVHDRIVELQEALDCGDGGGGCWW